MAVGKRTSPESPLTEHDVAERADKAALRVYRILAEAREMGLMPAVRGSRYFTNIMNALAHELVEWQVEPYPLKVEEHP